MSEETRSVDGKILVFGLIAILVVILSIVGGLVLALYGASGEVSQIRATILEKQEKITELNSQIYDLRRALDQTTGRLSVYEDFLVGTQVNAVKRMVKRFLRSKKTNSRKASVRQFEEWASGQVNAPRYAGLGGF